jgi:hypothetical protein
VTPVNRKKLLEIGKDLVKASKDNDNASTATYVILKHVRSLIHVLEDLHFRPEVNSED